jgi:small-conductance mechanosensitive channel
MIGQRLQSGHNGTFRDVMTIDELTRIIGAILAPAVMVTSCSIFTSALFNRYESMSARMRALHRERLDLLERAGQAGGASGQERRRIEEIERQLPGLLGRHRLVRNAILAVAVALLALVVGMLLIAAAALSHWLVVAGLALTAFLVGMAAFMAGAAISAAELWNSQREVAYEIEDGLAIR